MKRVIDADIETNCKKIGTALNRFFKKHPEVDEHAWREVFEYMYREGIAFESDNLLANGKPNDEWRYALHLEQNDDWFYIAVIERA